MYEDLVLYDKDFEVALANGIPKDVAYNRFYQKGWTKKRAITQPYKPRPKNHEKWKEVMEKSGVSRHLFYNRLRDGWEEERAATTPKMNDAERIQAMNKKFSGKTIITEELKELAQQNGIELGTLQQRIYIYKWDSMKAATKPVKSKHNWRKENEDASNQ